MKHEKNEEHLTLRQHIKNIIQKETRIDIDRDPNCGLSINVRQQKRIIEIVQLQVGRYYQQDLDSDNDISTFRSTLKQEAKALQIPVGLLAAYNEMSIGTIVNTQHMICITQSWFCQRILKEYGFGVYGIDVAETFDGEQERHVAILCRLVDGSYYLVDSAYPEGFGQIPGDLLKPNEVESGLARAWTLEKSFYETKLHQKVRILRFDNALKSWIFGNLSCLYSAVGDVAAGNATDEIAVAKYESSISYCEEALRVNPQKASVWNFLGYAHSALGDVYKDMGETHKTALEYQFAIESYNNAIENNPRYTDARNGLGFTFDKFGDLYKKEGMGDEAIQVYKKAIYSYKGALKINTKNVLVWHNLSWTLEKLAENDKAIMTIDCAMRAEKGETIGQKELEIIFLDLGV
jgi:tetratricopeptide (TPR) repeat protein